MRWPFRALRGRLRPGAGFAGFISSYAGDLSTKSAEAPNFQGDACYYPVSIGKTHVVTLDPNGGVCSTSAIGVDEDETLNAGIYRKLPEATREGAVFAGWFTRREGGIAFREDSAAFMRADTTLYAQWVFSIDGASIANIPAQAYTGQAVTPAVSATLNGKRLNPGIDFTAEYWDNVSPGLATVRIQGVGSYTGEATKQFVIKEAPRPSGGDSGGSSGAVPGQSTTQGKWVRLAGENAYGTMAAVLNEGWTSSDTVVVATFDGYWDALSASSIAGAYNAPILLTGASKLSPTTADQIKRLGATHAIIVGGKSAITKQCEAQIKSVLAGRKRVERMQGADAQGTAIDIAGKVPGASSTCIIATSNGYWDALAASPYAYRFKVPIYLTNPRGVLAPGTLQAIKARGYNRAIIVGGTAAVSPSTEGALRSAGVANVQRKAGADAILTSADFASFALSQGMSANRMAVATVNGYWDALTGGPLCGKSNSVLVLASGSNTANASIAGANRNVISRAYLLGGTAALPAGVLDAFDAATR